MEYFDSDGAAYITIFAGQSAEARARDYYDAIERGALDTRPPNPTKFPASICGIIANGCGLVQTLDCKKCQ
jgi:hypothetical protein